MADSSPARPATATAFASAGRAAEFYAAYDAVLATWPVPVEQVDLRSAYGTTRVNVCGPEDGEPLLLLHAAGATSTVWFANIADLSRTNRVYAVDQMGNPGRSVADGTPVRTIDDVLAWLDGVLDDLSLESTQVCGHSNGGWIALRYAIHAPERVRRLALLDPCRCFAGMRPSYLLHAVPLLARPTPARQRAFVEWETRGASLDAGWLRLAGLGATDFPASKMIVAHRPKDEELQTMTVPTLVLLAENSRIHDIGRVAANAHRLLPDVTTVVLPGVAHHSVPMVDAAALDRALLSFLD